MEILLPIFIGLPFMGLLLSGIWKESQERAISTSAFVAVGLQLHAGLIFCIAWIWQGMPSLNIKEVVLYKTEGYEFFIDLYFDRITAVYLMVGALLTFLITIYSRYYLHREKGYKRFFNTILFFYFGYNLTIFSGNFETLFIGWEVLGVSSFLLIAFYKDRYLPVKNAVKVFSIYRLGDIGIILAMWLSHHMWHHNITFLELNDFDHVEHMIQEHWNVGLIISVMILLAATVKSAQLPFSSWLPRAMEGPTPSSAIFYSSLSVHIGVFLLLRTFSFWEHEFWFRVSVAVLGATTALMATFTGRVQSTVKSQIAYSSITQIGIIFIEVAAGLEILALVHFAGNAFLRTYQLLVSPSVVTYLIREQFYNFVPKKHDNAHNWLGKLRHSVYVLSLREWNLDSLMFRFLWSPLKSLGNFLAYLKTPVMLYVFVPLYLVGALFLLKREILPSGLQQYLPEVFATIGLLMVLKSFTERKNTVKSWFLIVFNHCWIALAVSFNELFSYWHTGLYLAGVVVSGLIGYACLNRLISVEKEVNLDRFQGHSYEHPTMDFLFLLACLGLAGFPITTTFLGEDLIFSHIHDEQIFLAIAVALGFLIDGLSVIRIYARVFMGPHIKTYHEIADRSS